VAKSERGVCAVLMGDDPLLLVATLNDLLLHGHFNRAGSVAQTSDGLTSPTHDNRILDVADRILNMEDGRLV
jgi:hypothetical protein